MRARSSLTRRELHRGLLSLLALAACRPVAGPGPGPIAGARPRRAGPRKLLHINLGGGSDVLYSIDPKEPREVRPRIDPVFAPDQIVTRGELRLAPHWAPLARHLDRVQVIRGIQCSTVAHQTGCIQTRQLRRDVVSATGETAVAVMARAIDPEAPVACVQLGNGDGTFSTGPRSFADGKLGSMLEQLLGLANQDAVRDVLSAELAAELAAAGRTAGTGAEPLRAVEHLLTAMKGKSPPSPPALESLQGLDLGRLTLPPWFPRQRFLGYTMRQALQLEWALFVLQHDLSPAVYLESTYLWDTHVESSLQDPQAACFAALLAHLLDQLHQLRGADGTPLIDQVGVILTSGELGRFPYTNTQRGKDHFPQIAALLIGPGLRPGGFGETDRELTGTPVSLATGRPGRGGSLLTLDDLGRTLLEWAGVPAADLGYGGRVLDFALA
jgi:hypothetical protein